MDMIVDSINDTVKDTHSCVIYGIYGRWGEGKTSLMKFIESRLLLQGNDDNLYIVHFNPWLVGKQDALLREFFSSVRTSVDDAVRHFFDKYGSLAILASETIVNNLVPGIGASLGCCIKLAKRVLTDSEDTLVESKKKLSEDLAKSGKHCLVMVDDVDRLDREELHSVLRLVRQVADFDNFIYILAMDVDIVSKSIGSYYGEGCSHDGRKFIDKIVQVPIVLPPVTEDKIKDLLCENLSCCVGKYCVEDDEISRIVERIHPAIRTMRDLYRLCNQLSFVIPNLQGEVNMTDLCVLEVIKMISSEVYMNIYYNKSYLVNDSIIYYSQSGDEGYDEFYSKTVNALVEGLPEGSKIIVKRLVGYLFYKVDQYFDEQKDIEEKRLCTKEYFAKYFIQAVPSNLIPDKELDSFAQTISNRSVDDLTAWINTKSRQYDYGEIKRSLIYILNHSGKEIVQQESASLVARTLSFYYRIKDSSENMHWLMETSSFVAIQVIGKYLFIRERDYSGFKICNEALLNSTLTEIFRSTNLNYAMELLYHLSDYIAGSTKRISTSLIVLIDRFTSLTFEGQYSFSKDLLCRFFSCWKEVDLGKFVNYANDIFTNKNLPYVKVIDKFIGSKSGKTAEQDVNVFWGIFRQAAKAIKSRISEDPDVKQSDIAHLLLGLDATKEVSNKEDSDVS